MELSLNNGMSVERDWNEEIEQIAREELNEDPETRELFIEELRNWIIENEEFRGRTDDCFILQYLRISKYDVQKAKQRMRRYYEIRYKETKWFSKTEDMDNLVTSMLDKGIFYFMNFEGGCRHNIFIGHAEKMNPKIFNLEDICAAFVHSTEGLLEDPRSQAIGYQIVIDFKGLAFELIPQATPWLMWRFVRLWQNTIPIRVKGIHFVNVTPLLYAAIAVLKSLLTKKIKKRFFVHKINSNSFWELFPPEVLPNDFGGTAEPSKHYADALLDYFNNSRDLQRKNTKYGWKKGKESESE